MSHLVKERPRPLPWREFRAQLHHPWATPLSFGDWLVQQAAWMLGQWSLVELLEYIGSFSVLVAVVLWFTEAPERVQQKHYQAWQVINTAQGKGGNGGRIEALQQLNEDKVPLTGVDVSDAFLQGVSLPKAELRRADFGSADLRGANLRGARLQDANFHFANLRDADLRGADLSGANLSDADLSGADLRAAHLGGAVLDRADLRGANLSGLIDANSIQSIALANLDAARNAPAGFIAWAIERGAVQIADTPKWEARTGAATKPANSR